MIVEWHSRTEAVEQSRRVQPMGFNPRPLILQSSCKVFRSKTADLPENALIPAIPVNCPVR